MFEHRCLHNISRIWYNNFMSDSEVRSKIVGISLQSLEQALNKSRFG